MSMIYLDNAATSFPKPNKVIRDLNVCLKKYCGNPGRSSHFLSLKSAEAIYSTREKVASLLGISASESVVFTYNATYALNLAIKTFVTQNCHVLTSDIEHNSVIRPLEQLKKTHGIEYSCYSSSGDIEANVRALINENTTGIISTLASNVTGAEIPLPILSKIASEYGLFLIVDASQVIGHKKIDLGKYPCDVLCAPAHKALFGIQGCGFAVFKSNKRRGSFIEGGSGSDSESPEMPQLLPEGYEAGTLSTPTIVALGSGIDFIADIGITEVERKLCELTELLSDRLSSLGGINVYGANLGIVSFNISDLPSYSVAEYLDRVGVCTRAGLHCAPSVHRKLGTVERGAVRISLSYLNTKQDLDTLYKILKAYKD